MSCLEHDWSEPAMIPASAQLVGTRDSELTLECRIALDSFCELCACFNVRERKYGLTLEPTARCPRLILCWHGS